VLGLIEGATPALRRCENGCVVQWLKDRGTVAVDAVIAAIAPRLAVWALGGVLAALFLLPPGIVGVLALSLALLMQLAATKKMSRRRLIR
jgi:hypothetical protein